MSSANQNSPAYVLTLILNKLNAGITAAISGAVTLAAGSAIIGKVGIDQTTPGTTNAVLIDGKTANPTVTTSATPDYSIGDVISGILTLPTVNAASGRPVRLHSVTVKDKAGQAPALTVYLFKATPSGGTYTDNTALAWGSGDAANLVGVVSIQAANWVTLAGVSAVTLGGIAAIMADSATSLFALIVAASAYNAASTTDMSIEFGFEQM